MTNTDSTHPTIQLPTVANDDPASPAAKTIERADVTFGVIGARVNETRFAAGGRRYGVVFHRDVGDLSLQGDFSMSLGQDELMDLITAASTAYYEIEALRYQRKQQAHESSETGSFDQLEQNAGWALDSCDGFFPEQIEP